MPTISITSPSANSTVTLSSHNLPAAKVTISGYGVDFDTFVSADAKVYLASDTVPSTKPSGTTSFSSNPQPDTMAFTNVPCPGSASSAAYKLGVWATVSLEGDPIVLPGVSVAFTGNT